MLGPAVIRQKINAGHVGIDTARGAQCQLLVALELYRPLPGRGSRQDRGQHLLRPLPLRLMALDAECQRLVGVSVPELIGGVEILALSRDEGWNEHPVQADESQRRVTGGVEVLAEAGELIRRGA